MPNSFGSRGADGVSLGVPGVTSSIEATHRGRQPQPMILQLERARFMGVRNGAPRSTVVVAFPERGETVPAPRFIDATRRNESLGGK